jgi:ribosomal protein S18 acetylase RimI-like enzyme
LTSRNTFQNGFLRNHANWFATIADTSKANSSVAVTLANRHGHIVVPTDRPLPIGAIESGLTWLREQVAERLLIWADRDDPELDIVLQSRGLRAGFQPRWMLRDLSLPLPEITYPESIRIVRASLDDMPDLTKATDIPYVDLDLASKILRPGYESTIWMLLARDGESGPIVGHLTLFVPEDDSGWGGVYGAGVRPDRQRRGIGSALTLAACRIAHEAGATHLSLNATPDGERAYRKAGFEIVGDGRTWFAEFRANESRPDRETVAWAERLARGIPIGADSSLALIDTMPNGESPLAFAARFDQAASARWLIEHGAIGEIPALAKLGMWSEIETAVNDPSLLNTRIRPHGRTPLHIAVMENNRKLVSLLLSAGADTTIRDDEFKSTAQQWANHFGRADLARMIGESDN